MLCTHLHADHVGWNTRLENGRWVPTFRKARYLFSRIEQQHWDPSIGDRRAQNPGRAGMYDDSVLPVIESGQSVLLDGEHDIDDHLLVQPAPGHTPGHVVPRLSDSGEKAMFAAMFVIIRFKCMSRPGTRASARFPNRRAQRAGARWHIAPSTTRGYSRRTLQHLTSPGLSVARTAWR